MIKKTALLALAALSVSACGEIEYALPPAERLECPAEPDGPASAIVTDAENTGYLLALRAAGEGCRSNIRFLKDWFASLK